ncbi:DUF1501 domain-containing protein [Aquimarina sp. RZ0]|uniref:DUF1501 domain-containing protein n=1 Tax=Aquimarina sp. RZ0 TaxID=2607730 RepID=UPI0011F378CD|nr:DUF1501 domain-containing protein [Aquimarina sp. RZ0]KAA1246201.1 DUF1501 domain-containing protein [Aquimarina sp. RZ0]
MCDTHHKKIINKPGSCNHQEHKKWNRRSFLQALGIAGGGTVAFANTALSVSKPSPLSVAINEAETDRVLVIIRLKGGNDGLNTIIPVNQYDTYANARPTIRIKENDIYNLNSDYGIPKYANKFQELWGDGQMKVVHGVGYEDSALSHFSGSDIWATTDVTDQETTGWMGRYFETLYPDYLFNPPEKPAAIQIGSSGNLIFNGDDANFAFSVADPKKLFEIAQNGSLYDLSNLPDCTHGEKVGYLKGVANTTFAYAGVINEAYESTSDFGNYPDNKLSQQLSVVSRLIKGNLGTKVYLVTLGSFDTHNNQLNRQEELITQLSETVAHFYDDLKAAGWDDKVVSMTISEFGRRVKENGSNGTDHGTAAPMMLFGTGLEGNGFIGEHPDLSNLNNTGNLYNTTDFRQIYATLMKEWLCIDKNLVDEVLLGKEYDTLDIGFSCNTLGIDEETLNTQGFEHVVTYSENQSFLHITNTQSGHTNIDLYNMAGQKVATLKNEVLLEGTHVINVKEASKTQLSEGFYAYKITKGNQSYSKSIMIL